MDLLDRRVFSRLELESRMLHIEMRTEAGGELGQQRSGDLGAEHLCRYDDMRREHLRARGYGPHVHVVHIDDTLDVEDVAADLIDIGVGRDGVTEYAHDVPQQ
jgi:hypothetical protein